ncbi:hypothetical protein FRC02_000553 [Tulasnella sp. 418]|nr:hypothetical protein FRC02_000553 [Tulasnella sp. 418]
MSLTATMGAKLGPLVLATLVRHFLDRQVVTKDSKAREELLYDEAFIVVKAFMEAATRYTVEELQSFSNTRIPAPPWVRTVRVMIPMSSCDKAADHLIEALGGPEHAKKTVGGARWWQVRSLEGVPGEWIAVRRDIDAQRRRHKEAKRERQRAKGKSDGAKSPTHSDIIDDEPHEYSAEMEGTPCMLYIHGGGYYFGSIDQQRYTLHRYARKMSGRVFAINYRLAPQYPFPCAIQDALAAYLYLLYPPEGSLHCPVDPSLIILAGDSAGGGTCLALLQVIRDSGLPLPAGAVLISPWCDLTHSFPSCHENIASDIIPPYGLSVHKPSTLWPPPSRDETSQFRRTVSEKLKDAIRHGFSSRHDIADPHRKSEPHKRPDPPTTTTTLLGDNVVATPEQQSTSNTSASNVTEPHPVTHPPGMPDPSILAKFAVPAEGASLLVDGKPVTINSQIQFYALNDQLQHPLVTPALGYLGGLPPCFFIASDKEVIRDEIIHCAHKAAHPERYPIKDHVRELYPKIKDYEKNLKPTDVHLQVYDETCHVLPLFSFTTPAKYCYRAIATFCKFVTTPEATTTQLTPIESNVPSDTMRGSLLSVPDGGISRSSTFQGSIESSKAKQGRRRSVLRRQNSAPPPNSGRFSWFSLGPRVDSETEAKDTQTSGGSRSSTIDRRLLYKSDTPILSTDVGTAGHPAVYAVNTGMSPFENHMIRERVSTRGEIRPLEEESKLIACTLPLEEIGVLNERSVKRYLEGQERWDKKFHSVTKSIKRSREKNWHQAQKEGSVFLKRLQTRIQTGSQTHTPSPPSGCIQPSPSTSALSGALGIADEQLSCAYAQTVLGSRQWTWGWAVEGENPPPSSIVARRDTEEALRLSRIADVQLGPSDHEHAMSGNNLWSIIVETLTDPSGGARKIGSDVKGLNAPKRSRSASPIRNKRSFFSRIFSFSMPSRKNSIVPKEDSDNKERAEVVL